MFKSLLRKMIRKFELSYDYDASYMHKINSISPSATIRLMMLSGMTNFQGPEKSIWGGAALAATLQENCGSCAQLMIDRLLEQNLDSAELIACIHKDWPNALTTGLGFRFAYATLNNEACLTSLRAEILEKHGETALIAASYATVSYPVYPLLKRALGAVEACQNFEIGEYKNSKVSEYL